MTLRAVGGLTTRQVAEAYLGGRWDTPDLAELLAEQSLEGATSGDHVAENELNADVAIATAR